MLTVCQALQTSSWGAVLQHGVSKDGRLLGRAYCHPSRRVLADAPQDEAVDVSRLLKSLDRTSLHRASLDHTWSNLRTGSRERRGRRKSACRFRWETGRRDTSALARS